MAALTAGTRARLTAAEAAQRSRRVVVDAYRLHLDVDPSADAFGGQVDIAFTLTDAGKPLAIDFAGGLVDSVSAGNTAVDPDYDGATIRLPPDRLRVGRNVVTIRFCHPYGRHGAGLHRLVDPEDGAVYLYSHFEPFDANRMFPCFDQPDLKATFELSVEVPADWVVVSACRESAVERRDDVALWRFPRSARFSPYLFSLHAGPYAHSSSMAGRIPLRLFCRRTMAAHVDSAHWFELTQRGFAWFEDYFGIPYPYDKYDSVVVPDFNIGAMENVAAVTFSEAYVTRGAPTRRDRRRLAEVVLHEMSHMWFGNLVTMPWWNGLWLKESFATYVSHLAADKAIGLTDIWHAFSVESRQRAMRADQHVTTHPIDVPVPDTADAFAQFDAITYNKGASVLGQLAHYVGADAFRDGVRAYLSAHAGGTATLEDFVGAMAGVTDAPLDGWIAEWIHTAGVNTLAAQIERHGDTVKRLSIRQTAPDDWPTLRRHRVRVGLYRRTGSGRPEPVTGIATTICGTRSQVELPAAGCVADIVCPNDGDWTFARFDPDDHTLACLPETLSRLPDPMLRSQFVQAMWDRVRDARMPLQDYAAIVVDLVARDDDELVCRHALATLSEGLFVLARGGEPAARLLETASRQIDRVVLQRIVSSPPGTDMHRLFVDSFLAVGRDSEALHDMLAGRSGWPLDADRRWQALVRLAALGDPNIESCIEAESARDRSDRGSKNALAARAAIPDANAKAAWLDRLLDDDDDLALSRQRKVLGALFPDTQVPLHASLAPRILDALPALSASRDAAFLRAWATILPQLHREVDVAAIAGVAKTAATLHPVLGRALRVAAQESETGRKIVKLALNNGDPAGI